MANRLLRDWTASDTIDKLSERAEVFFTRLIMKADDHGCYYGNTKLLKAALFPLRDHQLAHIRAWRDECVAAGVLQLYAIDGKEYVRIINFGQRMRSMVSKFPQPADIPPTNDGGARTLVGDPPPEGKRREEEGKEKGKASHDFFSTNAEAYTWIVNNYQDIEQAKKILSNLGWRAVTDTDVGALLYHFLEGLKNLQDKTVIDVRQHFSNWLNKKPIDELTKLSLSIQFNHARRGQRPLQGQNAEIPGATNGVQDTG